MNITGPGLLDPVGLAALTADVKSLIQDTDTGEAADVSIASSTSINYATGASTTTETSTTLIAYTAPVTYRELRESPEYDVADISVIIVIADLDDVALSTDTRLTINSKPYTVLSVQADPLNIHARLICRRRE